MVPLLVGLVSLAVVLWFGLAGWISCKVQDRWGLGPSLIAFMVVWVPPMLALSAWLHQQAN